MRQRGRCRRRRFAPRNCYVLFAGYETCRKKYYKFLWLHSQWLTTCADCDLLAMLLLRVLSTSLRGMLPFFSALLRRTLPSSRGACRCLCGYALFHHGSDPLTRLKFARVLFVYCSSWNAWMTSLCF